MFLTQAELDRFQHGQFELNFEGKSYLGHSLCLGIRGKNTGLKTITIVPLWFAQGNRPGSTAQMWQKVQTRPASITVKFRDGGVKNGTDPNQIEITSPKEILILRTRDHPGNIPLDSIAEPSK